MGMKVAGFFQTHSRLTLIGSSDYFKTRPWVLLLRKLIDQHQFVLCSKFCLTFKPFQGYKVNRLSNTFKKFYGRHTGLVGQYKKNVCQMFADSIS